MKHWQQDWISKWALYSPDKMALKEYETSRTLTYAELNRCANATAYYLKNVLGLKSNESIAVLTDFNLEYCVLFSVAQKMGIRIVPLNYRQASAEISYILEDVSPLMIIVEPKFEYLIEHRENYFIWPLESFVTLCEESKSNPDIEDFPINEVSGDDPIFILYTAGTTGSPKGVFYTHKMLFWNSINTALSLIINTESRTVNVMPPFHTGGWNVLLTPFLHHGGYVCICKKFEPVATLQLLESEHATMFMGVPTMLQMMSDQTDFDSAVFSDLLYLISGGEPMPIPLIEKWKNKNVSVRQGYGMTEVGPNLTSLHQKDAIRKKGSIGRPNFYVNIKIIKADGSEALANEPGELWLQGPMVTPGYLNNQFTTREAFSHDGLWFKSGDIVLQDEENYLFVVDRIKNMYVSGAENIYPAEIEKVLIQHPAVKECLVIGIKDEKWGEVGKAFIVLSAPISKEEILEYTKTKLGKYKIPKHIEFIDSIPKSDAGKLDRKKFKL